MTDKQHICVTVLGAGRSGTSLSTRGLAAVGVDLGDCLRRGWVKNPTGFFEDRDLLALNQRLKRTLGIRGDSVRLIAPEEYNTPAIETLRHKAMHTIRRRFGRSPLWGYKYGRTLRLMPFWEPVYGALDLDMRYLVAIRNPLSVAASRGKLDPRRGVQETADHEWLVNVVPHFARARGRPLAVVDYDRLMADPRRQLARMATGLDLPDPDPKAIDIYCNEFLRPGMRHTQFSVADLDDGRVDPLVRDAYRWLDRLAGDEIAADDPAQWDAMWNDWARIAAGVEAMGPALAATDQAESARRRAERGPRQVYQWLRRKLRGG